MRPSNTPTALLQPAGPSTSSVPETRTSEPVMGSITLRLSASLIGRRLGFSGGAGSIENSLTAPLTMEMRTSSDLSIRRNGRGVACGNQRALEDLAAHGTRAFTAGEDAQQAGRAAGDGSAVLIVGDIDDPHTRADGDAGELGVVACFKLALGCGRNGGGHQKCGGGGTLPQSPACHDMTHDHHTFRLSGSRQTGAADLVALKNLPNPGGQTPQNGPSKSEKQRYCRCLEDIWASIVSFIC